MMGQNAVNILQNITKCILRLLFCKTFFKLFPGAFLQNISPMTSFEIIISIKPTHAHKGVFFLMLNINTH